MKPIGNYNYIFVVGVTGSGKSTLAEAMVDTFRHLYFKKKYTTRKIRPCECHKDTILQEYEFVTVQRFEQIANGELPTKFLHHYEIGTANGPYRYGFPIYKEGVTEAGLHSFIQVLGIADIESFLDNRGFTWIPKNSLFILMFVDEQSILSKLNERDADNNSENIRRITSEFDQFTEYASTFSKSRPFPVGEIIQSQYNLRVRSPFDILYIDNQGFKLSAQELVQRIFIMFTKAPTNIGDHQFYIDPTGEPIITSF